MIAAPGVVRREAVEVDVARQAEARVGLLQMPAGGGLHLGIVHIDMNVLGAGQGRHHLRINRKDARNPAGPRGLLMGPGEPSRLVRLPLRGK